METKKLGRIFSSGARKISHVMRGLIMVQIVLFAFTTHSWGATVKNENVNCSKGQTITAALQKSDGTPITIVVSGTCSENVVISHDDVTLVSYQSPGATINATNTQQDTITITGIRTVINGLTVGGGWNGIKVNGNSTITNTIVQGNGWAGIVVEGNAVINNATIQNNTKSGIGFRNGGRGTIDHCTIQSNGAHGVSIEGGAVMVTDSNISSNTVAGVAIWMGGSLRIGISDKMQYAGNTISKNGGSGIYIGTGGSAWIGGNTISENGKNPGTPYESAGIYVQGASATVAGGNIITNHSSPGVLAMGSTVSISHGRALGLPDTFNEINGNGFNGDDCNIRGWIGSSLEIGFTNIIGQTNLMKTGLCVSRNSIARITGPTNISNQKDGITLKLGGSLLINNPNFLNVSGNTRWGLNCPVPAFATQLGTQAHIEPFPEKDSNGKIVIPGISGNGFDVQDTCTSF